MAVLKIQRLTVFETFSFTKFIQQILGKIFPLTIKIDHYSYTFTKARYNIPEMLDG